MLWWDYGYLITSMVNRKVIFGSNTQNNIHIATVSRAMSSYEDKGHLRGGHGDSKGLDATDSKSMFPGFVPNASAPFVTLLRTKSYDQVNTCLQLAPPSQCLPNEENIGSYPSQIMVSHDTGEKGHSLLASAATPSSC